MASKLMKRCSSSFVISKIIMIHYYSPLRMAKSQQTDDKNCWRGCGTAGLFIPSCWDCKVVQPFQKTVLCFLQT